MHFLIKIKYDEGHMSEFFEIKRIVTLRNCVILLYVLRMLWKHENGALNCVTFPIIIPSTHVENQCERSHATHIIWTILLSH